MQNTARHIGDGEVADEIISSYREQIRAMRSTGPFDRCDTCFSELFRLFEKQVDLMQSLGIYQKAGDTSGAPAEIAGESVVKNILESVANVQRFQILKSLAVQIQTFSEISQMTRLRGGNLLFHIKKLSDLGMILQCHEREDYTVTDKGYKTMTTPSQVHRLLNPCYFIHPGDPPFLHYNDPDRLECPRPCVVREYKNCSDRLFIDPGELLGRYRPAGEHVWNETDTIVDHNFVTFRFFTIES